MTTGAAKPGGDGPAKTAGHATPTAGSKPALAGASKPAPTGTKPATSVARKAAPESSGQAAGGPPGSGAGDDERDVEDGAEGEKQMTFWEHLDELRSRLVRSLLAFAVACFVAWEVREPMLAFLVKPFTDSWRAQGLPGPATLHFAAPGAAFVAYVKLSMLGGITMAAPVVFHQVWAFVAPGLYAKEKRYVIPFVLMSTLLFVGGGYFGWRTAFPIAFNYFLSMSGAVGDQVSVVPTVMMGEYLDFVIQMLLGFGIVFELPLLITFLSIAGIVDYEKLIRFGRWFVLLAFAISAILTPPDVASQLTMALPMCILYGVSIGLAYVFGPKPAPEPPADTKTS